MSSEVEKRLLAEADYVYDQDKWEATHNDFGTLADEGDLTCLIKGEITTVGRLKSLPNAYAINIPVSFDGDGDPEDWEVQIFETLESAQSAYRKATGDAT